MKQKQGLKLGVGVLFCLVALSHLLLLSFLNQLLQLEHGLPVQILRQNVVVLCIVENVQLKKSLEDFLLVATLLVEVVYEGGVLLRKLLQEKLLILTSLQILVLKLKVALRETSRKRHLLLDELVQHDLLLHLLDVVGLLVSEALVDLLLVEVRAQQNILVELVELGRKALDLLLVRY